jgi:hypothetical protein
MTYGQIEYFAHRMKSVGAADEQLLVVLLVRNSYIILTIVLKRNTEDVKKNVGLDRVVQK